MLKAEESVSSRAVRAAGWSFGNTVAARLGTLAIGIALARALGPHEFGIFAIALVTQAALLSFNEAGVSLAIIRWREDPKTFAPTVNTIAVATSALLTVLVLVAAPWIAGALGDVRATPVVRLLAFSVLLDGLVATAAAALQREFMQRHRTIADQVNTWLGASLSLMLALTTSLGAMSLAIGRIVAGVVFAALLIRWSPIPYRFGWDGAVAARLVRFGAPLAGASLIVFGTGYADQMIVGSVAGVQALGFYVLAFNLSSWPVSIFSQPMRAVAPATFSALKQEPERMNRAFVRVLVVLSCVAVPACLAISGAAGPVVRFVYGASWAPAAGVLVWLAVFSALRIWFELCYDYLVVAGSPARVLIIQAVTFLIGVPFMLAVAGSQGGPGVAKVQFLVGVLVVLPLYVLTLRAGGVPPTALAGSVLLPLVVGLVVWSVARGGAAAFSSAAGATAIAVLASVLAIAGLGWWQRDNLRSLRSSGRQAVA